MAKSYYESEDLARRYLLYRPTYPKELYKTIVDFYEKGRGPTCQYQLAVDVGCGSGQATIPLAEYFHHVIGCDISKAQISYAPKDVDRVEFKVSPGERLGFLEDDSVDMLTTASALHYFDQNLFYSEARRVLKPGGVLAVFDGGFNILDNAEALDVYDEMIKFLDKYWKVNYDCAGVYREYELPFPNWTRIAGNQALTIHEKWTLSQFLGNITSEHAWDAYIKENPRSDYLDQVRKRILNAYEWEGPEDELLLNVTLNICLLIGRKP